MEKRVESELKKNVKSIRKGVKRFRKVKRIVKLAAQLSSNEPESDSDIDNCEELENDDD